MERLYTATRVTLAKWVETLRREIADDPGASRVNVRKKKMEFGGGRNEKKSSGAFPEKVTAFRSGMAAHGRYQQPCPRCNAKIQRIRYASDETNYCPTCQTGGKLLADRALSRLLRGDWPRTLEELEGLSRKA
ncbi:MAG TPA: zinc finger domain-containing protein [Pyrinomonadaceae bacterium]|nr:zinc finger domain-containing protein [Pyrinomonadaceae bacterium]